MDDGFFQVLATNGYIFLGGEAFDDRIGVFIALLPPEHLGGAELQAERLTETLREVLAARGAPLTDLIGPAPAFFARRRDFYRWHILLRAEDPADILRHVEIPAGWRVDVDPVSVL